MTGLVPGRRLVLEKEKKLKGGGLLVLLIHLSIYRCK